jgi:class 3 adenylate cyclase/tetratricopeptide (TPR) repeat protein
VTDRSHNPQFALYLPRLLLEWQSGDDPAPYLEVEGSLLLVDISGFTRMSEMLAAKGKVGSEEVTEVLNAAFTELLDIAMLDGGDLLRFGGDALFLVFTGEDHAARACRSAYDMRDALDDFSGKSSPTPLSMSVGVATGTIEGFLAGSSNREFMILGETGTEVVRLQTAAEPGEILICGNTAELIDDFAIGDEKEGGFLLEDAPDADFFEPEEGVAPPTRVDLGQFIPQRLRPHLTLSFNEGEHRLATIAFIKFAGVDELLSEQGPDAVQQALDNMLTSTQHAADRYQITFLATDVNDDGGKMILVTGVPERSDNPEERILRAVHEIVEADTELTLHGGIARGHVFAGDLGAAFRRVYTVMGDSVNLAARLAAQAKAGTALVTAKVLDRSHTLFDATQLDAIPLKGKAKPVAPFELGGILDSDAARDMHQVPFFGREEELEQLLVLAEAARRGTGHLVDLIGEPGIGKSRLLERLGDDLPSFTMVIGTNEPYESNTAYYTFGRIIRSLVDIKSNLTPEEVGAELSDRVADLAPALTPWVPLIALAIGGTAPDTPETASLQDQFLETKLHEVVAELLEILLPGPALIVIDDSQWMDDASRGLLNHLVTELGNTSWLICLSRRPVPAWSEPFPEEIVTEMALSPLPTEVSGRLIAAAVGDEPPPANVLEAMVARAEGNPFFLIELAGTSRGATDVDSLPETIEATAGARIDLLLPQDRRLLRYASVLGRQFSLDLLADVLPGIVTEETESWDRLSEFLDTTTFGKVRFRHAIIRDVAYEGLPFKRRREIHQGVGEALERRARNRPERFAELLSLHFDRAEIPRKAWTYSKLAGDRAQRKWANVEAAQFYKRGLQAAGQLDDVDTGERAAVAEDLGDVSELAGLYDDAWAAYSGALELIEADRVATARIVRKQGQVRERTGQLEEALDLIQKSLTTAGCDEPRDETAEVCLDTMLMLAGVKFRQGQYEESAKWCTDVLNAPAGSSAIKGHALQIRANCYTHLNHPDRSSDAERALELFEEAKDLLGQANVLNNMGYEAYFQGNWDEALDLWKRSETLRDKIGDVMGGATSRNNVAEILLEQGKYDEAEPLFAETLRTWRGGGYKVGVALAHANLGRLAARTGRPDTAASHLDEAEKGFTEIGAEGFVFETWVRKAENALLTGDPGAALPIIDMSLEKTAEASGATVLRAALHRLRGCALLALGNNEEARTELDASLTDARAASADHEIGLTLEALARWAQRTGTDAGEWTAERDDIFRHLGINAAPPVPIQV